MDEKISSLGLKFILDPEGANIEITDLTQVGRIGVEVESVDTTTFSAPDYFRTFEPTLLTAGEFALAGYIYDEEQFEDLYDIATGREKKTWKLENENGSYYTFSAFFQNFEKSEETPEGVRGFSGTLKVSGKPVFTKAVVSA